MLKLIQGATMYSPEPREKRHSPGTEDKTGIIQHYIGIGKHIDVELIDAKCKLQFPGFINSYGHIIGGGCECGL